jgi:hypothetical protein
LANSINAGLIWANPGQAVDHGEQAPYYKVPTATGVPRGQAKAVMDALRALALQSNEPSCYPFAENGVAQYLKTPGASLQKLREAIDHEAENAQEHIKFWTTMREYVRRRAADDALGRPRSCELFCPLRIYSVSGEQHDGRPNGRTSILFDRFAHCSKLK